MNYSSDDIRRAAAKDRLAAKRRQFEETKPTIITFKVRDNDGNERSYEIADTQIQTSPFLKADLHNHWHDGKAARVIRVTAIPIEVFDLYFNWLTHGKLDTGDINATAELRGERKTNRLAVELYQLGDLYMDHTFQNDVMDWIKAYSADCWNEFTPATPEDYEWALGIVHTSRSNDGLLRYLLEQGWLKDAVLWIVRKIKETEADSYGILFELCAVLMVMIHTEGSGPQDIRYDLCRYHKHSVGETNCFGEIQVGQAGSCGIDDSPSDEVNEEPPDALDMATLYSDWLIDIERSYEQTPYEQKARHVAELYSQADHALNRDFQNRLMDLLIIADPQWMWYRWSADMVVNALSRSYSNHALCRYMFIHALPAPQFQHVLHSLRELDNITTDDLERVSAWTFQRASTLHDEIEDMAYISMGETDEEYEITKSRWWCATYHMHQPAESLCAVERTAEEYEGEVELDEQVLEWYADSSLCNDAENEASGW